MSKQFSDLGFGTNLQSVKRIKIVTPTEIQQRAMPLLANKTDVGLAKRQEREKQLLLDYFTIN
jgi:superfamily II DNA/RNA helicase